MYSGSRRSVVMRLIYSPIHRPIESSAISISSALLQMSRLYWKLLVDSAINASAMTLRFVLSVGHRLNYRRFKLKIDYIFLNASSHRLHELRKGPRALTSGSRSLPSSSIPSLSLNFVFHTKMSRINTIVSACDIS